MGVVAFTKILKWDDQNKITLRNLGIITLKWGLLINEGRSIFCTKFNSKMFGVYKCIHKIYFPSKNSTSLLNAIGMPVSKYACDDDQLLSGRLST